MFGKDALTEISSQFESGKFILESTNDGKHFGFRDEKNVFVALNFREKEKISKRKVKEIIDEIKFHLEAPADHREPNLIVLPKKNWLVLPVDTFLSLGFMQEQMNLWFVFDQKRKQEKLLNYLSKSDAYQEIYQKIKNELVFASETYIRALALWRFELNEKEKIDNISKVYRSHDIETRKFTESRYYAFPLKPFLKFCGNFEEKKFSIQESLSEKIRRDLNRFESISKRINEENLYKVKAECGKLSGCDKSNDKPTLSSKPLYNLRIEKMNVDSFKEYIESVNKK